MRKIQILNGFNVQHDIYVEFVDCKYRDKIGFKTCTVKKIGP